MTTTEIGIDWKAKFEHSVSDAIEAKAKASIKLQEAQLELQKANQLIAKQAKEITKLQPAEEGRKISDEKWAARVNELNAEVQRYRSAVGRGQRGVIEDVIRMLQERASRLPAPEPQETDGGS